MAVAAVLAYAACSTLACTLATHDHAIVVANGSPAEKGKTDRDCNKRTEGQRTPTRKPCPDGGERLPQDRRSPLDTLPPLAPLVA